MDLFGHQCCVDTRICCFLSVAGFGKLKLWIMIQQYLDNFIFYIRVDAVELQDFADVSAFVCVFTPPPKISATLLIPVWTICLNAWAVYVGAARVRLFLQRHTVLRTLSYNCVPNRNTSTTAHGTLWRILVLTWVFWLTKFQECWKIRNRVSYGDRYTVGIGRGLCVYIGLFGACILNLQAHWRKTLRSAGYEKSEEA